jgi:hypothetical protein
MKETQRNLADFPGLGHAKDGLSAHGTRQLVVGDYLFDYGVDKDVGYITAVRPGMKPEVVVDIDDDVNYEDK